MPQFPVISFKLAVFEVLAALLGLSSVQADVVVIVNRTSSTVHFETVDQRELVQGKVVPENAVPVEARRQWTLASSELVTIAMRSTTIVSCPTAQPVDYELEANSAYYFKASPDRSLVLEQIDLGSDARTRVGRNLGRIENAKATSIPVKILVDDNEPAAQGVWEARLRQRLAEASEIMSPLFQVQFEVVSAETWESASESGNLEDVLQEFESKVRVDSARLAIGFTSQFRVAANESPPEVVRPPLHSHLLLCERPGRLTEAERLELLVHALGHYLGAVHSPEPKSVMRAPLSDGQARRSDFRIRFDPVNALLAYLTAEELRFRNVSGFSQILPGTALRLRQLYTVVDEVLPADPLAIKNLGLLRIEEVASPTIKMAPRLDMVQSKVTPSIVAEATGILRRIREAAQAEASKSPRKSGDELTAYYIRVASRAGEALQSESAPRAFLVAIGIGLDDSDLLRNNPLLGETCRSIETMEECAERRRVLGSPTMLGRRDLAQHFVISAFLTGAYGEDVATAFGIAKELLDVRGASGFSFGDLAADRAGIVWARHLLSRKLTLSDLASSFAVTDFMPSTKDLPEGLSWDTFVRRYGSMDDERCRRMQTEIQQRIDQLPGYRPHPPLHPRRKVISSNSRAIRAARSGPASS